jgi:hypothetical protein
MTRVSAGWRSISLENKQLSLPLGLDLDNEPSFQARELKNLPNGENMMGKMNCGKQLW